MREIDYVRDNAFLKRLDRENIKEYLEMEDWWVVTTSYDWEKWLALAKEAVSRALDCSKDEIIEQEEHAGYECSWWAWAIKNVEKVNDGGCICLGVNVTNEHEFTEAVQVDSIKQCMNAVAYMFENSIKI